MKPTGEHAHPRAPGSFLCEIRDWLSPVDLNALFGREAPLEVDFGCGEGAFLLERARKRPERNLLGIDRLKGRLRKLDRKLLRSGLANVRLWRAEIDYSVRFLLPRASMVEGHFLFPDPWPKKKHFRRRLFTPEFADALVRDLAFGGHLNVATDDPVNFADIRTLLVAKDSLVEVPATAQEAETDFERQFRAAGRQILCGRWRKVH